MEQQLGNEYVTNVTNETMFASGGVANGGVAKKRIAVGYAMVHIEWIPQLVRAFVLDESEMKWGNERKTPSRLNDGMNECDAMLIGDMRVLVLLPPAQLRALAVVGGPACAGAEGKRDKMSIWIECQIPATHEIEKDEIESMYS